MYEGGVVRVVESDWELFQGVGSCHRKLTVTGARKPVMSRSFYLELEEWI